MSEFVTVGTLQTMFPHIKLAIRQIYAVQFNKWLPIYAINTPERLAAFFAQIGHESGGLQYTAELWGPTPQQLKYEPPSELAGRLGNTLPGDGKLFRGRGLIQITGRHNYAELSRALEFNFIEQPRQLVTCQWAVKSACWWWQDRKLNELADLNNLESFRKITRIINGGYNGLEDRVERWQVAKKIFLASGKDNKTVA